MIITNIEYVPGSRITEHLGLVQGNTVQTKNVGRDFMAGLKNIFGGELRGYTELLNDAREEATRRMVDQAASLGATAVINVRYSTSSITAGAAELFVYGTAVRIAPDHSPENAPPPQTETEEYTVPKPPESPESPESKEVAAPMIESNDLDLPDEAYAPDAGGTKDE